MAEPCLESTTWVALTQNQNGQLRVDLNPSTRQGNSFRLDNDGIFVPGYVAQTNLPPSGSARDGDLWRWESPDNPAVQWNLIYSDAAGAWVWHSGGELYDEATTNGTRPQTGSPVFADASGGGIGPQVTVPFAGQYVATYGARIAAATDGNGAMMSLTYGNPAADADAVRQANQYTAAVTRKRVLTVAAPGQTILAKYKNTSAAGGDANFADRFLFVHPLSVS